ncbi:S-type pyocin domain-containing protein [Pseudomonas sp. GD03858]|uniref:S-type pyocin domain-containing protein n=1 Tax=unclassified Pseudomonas TaxID=196821 RepID=UPI002447308A|nr:MULTISPECIES: S-type pyocin domain-containing protein [unclassified Pseudomonas]MDH0649170.1 S-type pyocin domain-containing protein [Pseudomonas sp. GD03867]MDH0665336.1 S-type pyocin domain-containing protein [Pseudomonas sp. GD03858]
MIDLVPQIERDKQQVQQEHEQLLADLDTQLDQAIAVRAGSLAGLSEIAGLESRISAVERLRAEQQARQQSVQQQAHRFFGGDPVHRSFKEFVAVTRQANPGDDPRQAWLTSYRAAFEAKRLALSVARLAGTRARLQTEYGNAKYRSRQRDSIDRLINQIESRLNQALESRHDHQTSKEALSQLLTAFERHAHDDIAEQAALAHAQELERETSDLIRARAVLRKQAFLTDLNAKSLLSTPASLDHALRFEKPYAPIGRKDEITRLKQRIADYSNLHQSMWPSEKASSDVLEAQARQAISAAFEEQLYLSTLSGRTPSNTPVTFNAWTASTTHPLILATTRGAVAHFEAIWAAFAETLGKAALTLLTQTALGALRYAPLMLYSARLGDGERMGVTVPLASMTPGADLSHEANRRAGQTLELPLRMNAVPAGEQTEVYLAATDGSGMLRDVRVRQAQWDPGHGAYRFTAEGPGGATLLWHPATPPSSLDTYDPETGNAIPALPIVEDLQKHYPGSIQVPREPNIRTFPAIPDADIDDYVIIFPADSGLAPIYVMLRNPRKIPGYSSGVGQLTSDRFLEGAITAQGAPIPSRIAEKLTGRWYAEFDRLREAFWKEVAADNLLNKHFTKTNLREMRKGNAPFAPTAERVGGRKRFELHHIEEIAKGGAVYNLDNIVIMSAKRHINHHSGR